MSPNLLTRSLHGYSPSSKGGMHEEQVRAPGIAQAPASDRVCQGAATAPSGERGQRVLAMDEVFPPHDFGPWPEGFS